MTVRGQSACWFLLVMSITVGFNAALPWLVSFLVQVLHQSLNVAPNVFWLPVSGVPCVNSRAPSYS